MGPWTAETSDNHTVYIEASHLANGPGSGGLSLNTTYVWLSFDGVTWWKTSFRSKTALMAHCGLLSLEDLKIEIETSY